MKKDTWMKVVRELWWYAKILWILGLITFALYVVFPMSLDYITAEIDADEYDRTQLFVVKLLPLWLLVTIICLSARMIYRYYQAWKGRE